MCVGVGWGGGGGDAQAPVLKSTVLLEQFF